MITERDYQSNEDAKLKEFAEYIDRSGLSLYAIMKGTGLCWRTVFKAAQGIALHSTTERRIRLFIEKTKEDLK